MPNFEYRCRICGFEFECLSSLGTRDIASCPKCFCVAEKKLSAFNFTFGFRLSDESQYVKGTKDEFVRNV